MKKITFLVLIVLFGTIFTNAAIAPDPRIEQLFNFDWKFKLGDPSGAWKIDFNDQDWRNLDLPHDFHIEQSWDSTASQARGFKQMESGWYRKKFTADKRWQGRKVFLDFEGIMLNGDVWLNGKMVGGTDYGYLGFEAEISKVIRYDSVNVIAVRATTGANENSRWYTGGGLFRDVHLVVKNKTSVARHGIYITTPEVSAENAKVNVQVELEGFRMESTDLDVQVQIISPEGKEVASVAMKAPKRNKLSLVDAHLPAISLEMPSLWSCEQPNLYTARVSLIKDGEVIDQLSDKFGIRTIEFSKDYGFKLNGKKVFLKGIANHHDLGAVGVAAYERSIARQMDRLKEFGFNHIRTSHNPYSESFLRLADEKGILIVDELYDKWSNTSYWAGRKPWTELWYQNVPEWIKRDRNHPSVIMWSFGNELQINESWAGFPTNDWGITTYKLLKVLANRYDSTRKTTVAMFPARGGSYTKNEPEFHTLLYPPDLATVTEISSFNYRWNSYQEYLKHNPDMIVYQSEATTNELVAPFFGMDRDKMVGLAYWGAIEYWGESNGWPKKGWNYSYFNHALEPFPQAYLIKSIFTDEPVVRIGVAQRNDTLTWNDIVVGQKEIVSDWNLHTGSKYDVFTYSNADDVELFVNGISLGIHQNNTEIEKRNMILWQDVPYRAGKILAVARKNGKEVARHEIETAGKAVALKVVSENADWKADGMDLQYIKVYAVDSKGRRVQDVSSQATFEVVGAAKLIAVDNGDHYSNELFAGNMRTMYKGFAMAILRANQKPGEVQVKITVQGIGSAKVKLLAK